MAEQDLETIAKQLAVECLGGDYASLEIRAAAAGIPVRNGRVEGSYRVLTRDYIPHRLTATIQDGLVTELRRG